jgi:hypothetical protein
MANVYATQGRLIIDALKRRPYTYGDMLALRVSTSPWKRVRECLRHDERLVKGERKGLTTWRVVAA